MNFDIGRPTMHPRDCGKPIEDFDLTALTALPAALTAAEQADPDAAYYAQEFEVPAELQKAFDGEPMDPAAAFLPKEYGGKMNNSGHCPVETGYCVLENGVAYASACIRQEGITDEMVAFYNEQFCKTDDLFYKTWCPGYHIRHYTNGCLEDFGFGRRNMRFAAPVDIRDLGIDPEKVLERDPDCIYIGGINTEGYNLDGLKAGIADKDMILKYHRVTPYGRELRVRIWYGLNLRDGEYSYAMPEGGQPLWVARSCMRHIILEESNAVRHMKQFWAQHHK